MPVRLVTKLQTFTEREDGAAESLRYADLLVANLAPKPPSALNGPALTPALSPGVRENLVEPQ